MPKKDAAYYSSRRDKINKEKEERKKRGRDRIAESKAKRQNTVSDAVETTPVGLMEAL